MSVCGLLLFTLSVGPSVQSRHAGNVSPACLLLLDCVMCGRLSGVVVSLRACVHACEPWHNTAQAQ